MEKVYLYITHISSTVVENILMIVGML